MRRWVINVLIAIDQLANAILRGRPVETISLRSAIARDRGKRWGCVMCKLLEAIVANHCDTTKHDAITAAGVTVARIFPKTRNT